MVRCVPHYDVHQHLREIASELLTALFTARAGSTTNDSAGSCACIGILGVNGDEVKKDSMISFDGSLFKLANVFLFFRGGVSHFTGDLGTREGVEGPSH